MSARATTPGRGDASSESPAIHVALAPDADAAGYGWAAVGAEELGIPSRNRSQDIMSGTPDEAKADAIELAYRCARESRLGIGVGISADRIAIHERHMPADRPVVQRALDDRADNDATARHCRSAGANAARLVAGRPLRLDD